MSGTIVRLISDRHFGFIRADDGQEVFFHASALAAGDFAALTVNQTVDFDLERGEKGPKAANVRAS